MGRQCSGPSGFFDSESDSQTDGWERSRQNAADAANRFPQQSTKSGGQQAPRQQGVENDTGRLHIFANPVGDAIPTVTVQGIVRVA